MTHSFSLKSRSGVIGEIAVSMDEAATEMYRAAQPDPLKNDLPPALALDIELTPMELGSMSVPSASWRRKAVGSESIVPGGLSSKAGASREVSTRVYNRNLRSISHPNCLQNVRVRDHVSRIF